MKNKYRLTNISGITAGRGPGRMLDHPTGGVVGVGKSILLELPAGPTTLEEKWVTSRWAKLQKVDEDGTVVEEASAPKEDLPAQAKVDTVAGSQLPEDELTNMDDEFDPSLAKEASLPGVTPGAHLPPIDQDSAAKARVSMTGAESEGTSLSPIPGDKPRSVDDADAFTVKAPRSAGVGAVVKSP